MSVSASSNERRTAIMRTADVANDTSDTVEMDAPEDRRIVGVQLTMRSVAAGETHNGETYLYLGNDPDPAKDSVDTTEELYVRHEVVKSHDDTNGVGSQGTPEDVYFDFSGEPFHWDEHVTATLDHREGNADSSSGQAVIHYVEA